MDKIIFKKHTHSKNQKHVLHSHHNSHWGVPSLILACGAALVWLLLITSL